MASAWNPARQQKVERFADELVRVRAMTPDEQQTLHQGTFEASSAGTVTEAEQRVIQDAATTARQEAARVAVQQGRRILQEQARGKPGNVGPRCTRAEPGWVCHRAEGHDGPCAAS